jgi:hypothetical protein
MHRLQSRLLTSRGRVREATRPLDAILSLREIKSVDIVVITYTEARAVRVEPTQGDTVRSEPRCGREARSQIVIGTQRSSVSMAPVKRKE